MKSAKRPLISRLPVAARAFWREVSGKKRTLPVQTLGFPGGYHGADMSRLMSDWIAALLSPDDETKMSARVLRARARDLDRNSGIASHFLDLLSDNVVGPTGPTIDSEVEDAKGEQLDDINEKIEKTWNRWAKGPVTLDGSHDLVGFLDLLIRTVATDGEAFIRFHRGPEFPWGFALEMVDADLVDDTINRAAKDGENEIRMGIEVDMRGRKVAYWVRRDPAYHPTRRQTWEQVLARDMVHVFRPKRVNQTRGITWFAPVMRDMRHESEYTATELVASRVASSKCLVYESMPGMEGEVAPEESEDTPAGDGSNTDDGGGFREELEPGVGWVLPRGYKANLLDPTHPTTAFPSFIKTIQRKISSGLTAAYNVLMNDLEGVSFSSIRSGTLAERDHYVKLQGWLFFRFLQPLVAEWTNSALLTGQLSLPSRDPARYAHFITFVGRRWDWVDPESDVNSEIKAIRWGITSREQILKARGIHNVKKLFQQLGREKAWAEEFGIEIEDAPPGGKAGADEGGNGAPARSRLRRFLNGSPPPAPSENGVSTNGSHQEA